MYSLNFTIYFFKGCLKRLKDSRERLVNSFRHSPLGSPSSSQELVNQVMIHEWEQMKLESPLLSRLPQHLSCSKDEQFVLQYFITILVIGCLSSLF